MVSRRGFLAGVAAVFGGALRALSSAAVPVDLQFSIPFAWVEPKVTRLDVLYGFSTIQPGFAVRIQDEDETLVELFQGDC